MLNHLHLIALLGAGLAAATSILGTHMSCDEGGRNVCYGRDGGVSQHLNVDDVKRIADYLRQINDDNEGSAKFWTMPETSGCSEWTLPVPGPGSVLALAKHTKPHINSSILYEDLAHTIDGGENASKDEQNKTIIGCGENGGQFFVVANGSNPEYYTDEYKKSQNKPEGILIKLVKAP